jgi:hypothetical protein
VAIHGHGENKKEYAMIQLRLMNHDEYLEYKKIVVEELADALMKGGFVESSNSL